VKTATFGQKKGGEDQWKKGKEAPWKGDKKQTGFTKGGKPVAYKQTHEIIRGNEHLGDLSPIGGGGRAKKGELRSREGTESADHRQKKKRSTRL